MEIGIDSFAAILPDPATGKLPSPTDRMAELIEEVVVADRVGLDVFGIGEHHRGEFLELRPDRHSGRSSGPLYAYPVDERGNGSERSRSSAVIPGIRDSRPDFQGPCGARGRPGFLHRGLPAVRP